MLNIDSLSSSAFFFTTIPYSFSQSTLFKFTCSFAEYRLLPLLSAASWRPEPFSASPLYASSGPAGYLSELCISSLCCLTRFDTIIEPLYSLPWLGKLPIVGGLLDAGLCFILTYIPLVGARWTFLGLLAFSIARALIGGLPPSGASSIGLFWAKFTL